MTAGETTILEEVRSVRKEFSARMSAVEKSVAEIKTGMECQEKQKASTVVKFCTVFAGMSALAALAAVFVPLFSARAESAEARNTSTHKSTKYTNGTLCDVLKPDL